MASLVLSGDTSGSLTVSAPAVAGSNTQTLVATTGTLAPIVSGTAWTYTSGTPSTIDFTGIPSWVKRITVMIAGLSYAAAGNSVIQIGSGSLSTSGYTGRTQNLTTTPSSSFSADITNGLGNIGTSAAATTIIGSFVLTNVTGNQWLAVGQTMRVGDSISNWHTGFITLGGALDRLSLVATTSTFDAGTINILYE